MTTLADQYKIHETPESRLAERPALSAFRNKILPGRLLYQTESLTRIDAIACDQFNAIVAVIEIKRRRDPLKTYPTWAIEIAKAQAGWFESERLDVPFYFVFEWQNALFYLNMTEKRMEVEASTQGLMQRNDRDELPDLCYYVDRNLFTEIV